MKYFFLLILYVVLSMSAIASTPEEVLENMKRSMDSHSSVAYECAVQYKSLSRDDTLRFSAAVAMLREAKDSLAGGYLGYVTDNPDEMGIFRIYDLKNIYKANPADNTVIRYFPAKGQDWALMPTTSSIAVYSDFLRTESITQKNQLKESLLADTSLEAVSCHHIVFTGTTTAGDLENHIYISSEDNFPILISNHVSVDGLSSFKEFRFSSVKFDNLTNDDFDIAKQLGDVKITDFDDQSSTDAKPQLLAVGTPAPEIKGKNFQNGLAETKVEFSGKVTLLDFWYMNCPWCIKAFPEIEKLIEKFPKDKFQIIGINSRDNNEKGLARLPKFLLRIPMKYQTILVPSKLPDDYHISGWPTFYIIDKNGNVAGTYIGYEEDMEKVLTEMIQKLLK